MKTSVDLTKLKYNSEVQKHQIDGVDFDGHFLEWGTSYTPKTYLKDSHLSGREWRKGGEVQILLNGDCVKREMCREPERALMLMSKYLHELQCWFEIRGIQFANTWKKDIVGAKVYLGHIKSTVVSYVGDGEVIIKSDDGTKFQEYLYPTLYNDPDYDDEWGDEDKVHITDKRISWIV